MTMAMDGLHSHPSILDTRVSASLDLNAQNFPRQHPQCRLGPVSVLFETGKLGRVPDQPWRVAQAQHRQIVLYVVPDQDARLLFGSAYFVLPPQQILDGGPHLFERPRQPQMPRRHAADKSTTLTRASASSRPSAPTPTISQSSAMYLPTARPGVRPAFSRSVTADEAAASVSPTAAAPTLARPPDSVDVATPPNPYACAMSSAEMSWSSAHSASDGVMPLGSIWPLPLWS
ncbi:uncharacterized protein SPSK_07766 [Sporothrix schenckii 1099-18]|uniref:Uncharacterized protein n=1 Tax=Sporothrix schenckii 1099-18 TaxID=1397361 RepID=A0A0F2MIB3_SPOSC|nr:uncharacterized protein SPSK_07766 [Sporothrix schenckii 1099-18]KJR87921.1 hypothetical protein SPSK_07766 [Sporothrix schenckii 1099-18]